jgi:hypothetical protein
MWEEIEHGRKAGRAAALPNFNRETAVGRRILEIMRGGDERDAARGGARKPNP